ncbi:hypothetical protein, partial [Treponema endosymbiont of Eucomonympha sp.]|uniref:hypothetical protein n=1 Tax=Treponema endosymbiont of Eucomonympha sp. TaxID=1580831 RepID=UPI001EE76AB4
MKAIAYPDAPYASGASGYAKICPALGNKDTPLLAAGYQTLEETNKKPGSYLLSRREGSIIGVRGLD